MWQNFVTIAKSLDQDQKSKMRERWNEHSGGKAVPTNIDAVSPEDLEFILAEASKLKFE
jgi:hypothetical protein